MKLELKHLAPYLPYGLKIKTNNLIREMRPSQIHHHKYTPINNVIDGTGHKPILRPLADLTKDEETFKFLLLMCHKIDENLDYVCEFSGDLTNTSLSYRAVLILITNHFDVFGLIPEGLAIDINTLKK